MSRLLYGDESFLRREELGDGVYRIPTVVGVAPGETVTDDWSQPHTAPAYGTGWELWKAVYAPDNTFLHYEWRADRGGRAMSSHGYSNASLLQAAAGWTEDAAPAEAQT